MMRRTTAGLAVWLAIAGLALTGCDDPPPDGPPVPTKDTNFACAKAGGEMALAIGARANSPRPQIPGEVWTLIHQSAWAKKKISVYRLDGDPAEAFTATFPAASQEPDRLKKEYEGFIATLDEKLRAVRAKVPEADVLKAITLAGREVGEDGTVIVLDSGLQTVAPLDFRTMLEAEPDEVAEFLQKEDLLPDLSKRTIVFLYLGDTAEPQSTLDKRWSDHVAQIWEGIVKKAGAGCVEIVRGDVGGRQAATAEPRVSLVKSPPPPDLSACGLTVLYDSGPVGFLPNKAEFRDEASALVQIQKLAEILKNPRRSVELIGTTAGRTTEFAKDLSRRRADLVKQHLIRLGVPAERINAWGAAADGPWHEPDIDPRGVQIPGPAAHNRSVRVDVKCQ